MLPQHACAENIVVIEGANLHESEIIWEVAMKQKKRFWKVKKRTIVKVPLHDEFIFL